MKQSLKDNFGRFYLAGMCVFLLVVMQGGVKLTYVTLELMTQLLLVCVALLYLSPFFAEQCLKSSRFDKK